MTADNNNSSDSLISKLLWGTDINNSNPTSYGDVVDFGAADDDAWSITNHPPGDDELPPKTANIVGLSPVANEDPETRDERPWDTAITGDESNPLSFGTPSWLWFQGGQLIAYSIGIVDPNETDPETGEPIANPPEVSYIYFENIQEWIVDGSRTSKQ